MLRTLFDRRHAKLAELRQAQDAEKQAQEQARKLKGELRSITSQRDHEINEMHRRRQHDTESAAAGDGTRAFPCPAGRVLRVDPGYDERNRSRKRTLPTGAYPTFEDAMDAARPGDVISLTPGEYELGMHGEDEEMLTFRKSVQVVADERCELGDVVLVIGGPAYRGEGCIEVEGGVCVRFAGLQLTLMVTDEQSTPDSVVLTGSGGGVWFENCTIAMMGEIVIGESQTLDMQGCKLTGAAGSAICIHPKATRVCVTDSVITGCSKKDEGFRCGESGAIELRDDHLGWEKVAPTAAVDLSKVDLAVTVRIELSRNSIEGNYGHGISYRTTSRHGNRRPYFSRPGPPLAAAFTLHGNTIRGNGLAQRFRSEPRPIPDGECVVDNLEPQGDHAARGSHHPMAPF